MSAGSRRTTAPSADGRSTAACTGRRRSRRVRSGRGRRSPGGRPSGHRANDRHAGQHLLVARRRACAAPTARRAAGRPARTTPAAAGSCPSANSHSSAWATIRARGKARSPSAVRSPPAWSKWRWLTATRSTVSGSKPASRSAGRIGSPGHATLSAVMLVHALADARLDQDAASRRLHEQAVERLVERVVGVDLGLDEALPHHLGHGPEDRARVRRERAGLDERDGDATAEVSAASRPTRWSALRAAFRGYLARRLEVLVVQRRGRASTGPGTSTRARASRTAARPGSTS